MEVVRSHMSLSKKGEDFLQKVEGSVKDIKGLHKVYLDTAQFQTIGYGHKLTPSEASSGKILLMKEFVRYTDGLTEEQADIIFRRDVRVTERAVNDWVKIPLVQHEFDALVSFTFNVGVFAFMSSTLLKVINNAKYTDSEEYVALTENQFKRWIYSGGRKTEGLLRRRIKEAKLFNEGKYE